MVRYKFFWKGILSNWKKSNFTIGGINYNCGEQAMMYHKAILFSDFEIASKILKSSNPKEIKRLGRSVKGFDAKVWDRAKYEIVKNIIRARITYDDKFRAEVSRFKTYKFVEASPFDRIWGIGFEETDALANVDKWGESLLGEAITEVAREYFKDHNCEIVPNIIRQYENESCRS